MKITFRLKTIADLIDIGTNVIDIGCDHALLDIYLTLNNRNKCIASDINNNALKGAKENIIKYKLEDKIDVVVSDGLKNINIPPNNTIVICGMGTQTILNILSDTDISKIDNLVIQSNNDLYNLRKEINNLGFIIEKEEIIYDKKIYYTIIKFKKGQKKYKYYEYLYGLNYDNKEYINYSIIKLETILKKLPSNRIIKINKLKREIKYLKKHL